MTTEERVEALERELARAKGRNCRVLSPVALAVAVVLCIGCKAELSETHKQLIRNARQEMALFSSDDAWAKTPSLDALDEIPGLEVLELRGFGSDVKYNAVAVDLATRQMKIEAPGPYSPGREKKEAEVLGLYQLFLDSRRRFDNACASLLKSGKIDKQLIEEKAKADQDRNLKMKSETEPH